MKKYSVWIYVRSDGGDTPVVKAFPTKFAVKNAVKLAFEEYMEILSPDEKEKAIEQFKEKREEDFILHLPDGKTVHCYMVKSTYEYYSMSFR